MTREDYLRCVGAKSEHDPYRCAMCGKSHWTACWIGHQDILLCRDCAIENLAGLFVDAIWCAPYRSVADAERDLDRFATRFYRAVALKFAARPRV